MGQPLRVLVIEDNVDDADLILRVLKRGGYEPHAERVQTAEDLAAALAGGTWDIVLSDYSMPQFNALDALAILRARSGYLPFIVISGSIGEETAVQTMRAGANDYLMKTNLTRLLPAVERELREAEERRERARTRKALLELQEQFQVIFREFTDVMLIARADTGEVLHANLALGRTLGYGDHLFVGSSLETLWPADRRHEASAMLERARREGSVFLSAELLRLDGSRCPMDVLASLVPWDRDQAVVVTLRDVTERQRAEQRLANEKEQLVVTLCSIGEGVITTDTGGYIVLMNPVAENLTGWHQDEAAGRPLGEVLRLFQANGKEPLPSPIDRLLHADGEAAGMAERTRNISLKARNGRTCALNLTAAPIRDHHGKTAGAVLVFRDTTDEQKLEEDLQKASKLESVGLLAGGIAHDFNNILMAILGNLSLAKVNAGDSPEYQAAVAMIEKAERACRYATDLTRQLLTFAKGGEPIKEVAVVSEILQEAVNFALHGAHLKGRFELPADLHPVEVDRNQIRQVIDNLVINAIQASPEGGELTVAARNVTVAADAPVGNLAPGDYVCISIRDTGVGIAPEALPKIFDPYFTTKEAGTGLGLATAYSIIKRHAGLIRVRSELGVGTTFFIYLPASTGAAPVPRGENVFMPAGRGRILFMDDEEVLRELVAGMLGHLGYEVACAPDGQDALLQFVAAREAGKPFDGVIVDLTVPGGMGGFEAVQLLREIDPNVRAIVSSGYSNDPIMADYRGHGFNGFIAKPYQIIELAKVLHEVLKPDG